MSHLNNYQRTFQNSNRKRFNFLQCNIWDRSSSFAQSKRVITFSFLNGASTALFEDSVIAFPKEVIKQEKSESMCLISTDPDCLQAYN